MWVPRLVKVYSPVMTSRVVQYPKEWGLRYWHEELVRSILRVHDVGRFDISVPTEVDLKFNTVSWVCLPTDTPFR